MKKQSKKATGVEEYVLINGIHQYLFHSGTIDENPVLLFLHGGPGSAASLFAHAFQDRWEELFTVVHWDQRGTGKTLTKNPESYPTLEVLLQDILEIVHYLKSRYHKQKIVLLGHSWGSVLGSLFVQNHPEEVEYYIGVGQVINKLASERLIYAKVKEAIVQANDQRDLKKLEALGDYPGEQSDPQWLKKSLQLRKLQGKYHLTMKSNVSPLKTLWASPLFRFSDLSALVKGNKANKEIMDLLGSFDLNAAPIDYKVPLYYIAGEQDWQTPLALVQDYVQRINAPEKKIYIIPNAGHMTMIDQLALFLNSLRDIKNSQL
ncbi:alpha/beta hydrolase [Tengunoibacter tsumagoiensis]|uniref:prolyl aminopeptidase n=1 Tax=Tengunoibacter tsumagoiensis TaxID=2014871 RepID=A0A401ZTT0_9CHLR|nr:alpha/beta hydrolase [Tengunoibacter tsumagoiensis]GCE10174.1 alpha/beta hydrolase [Tengunoibacter tsumagoiensis]